MKFQKTQIAVAVAGIMSLLTTNAYAQTTDSAERVTVTGSNIKRAAREGSSPIETITAKEIKESGAKTVLELMRLVPAMGAEGYVDNASQNTFSSGVATASLRSLSSTSTLILLNGRRMTPSAYANPNNGTSTLYDLNSIPLSAIERVDIFKDGASAIYGSDAIGGVINFITKSDYRGLEVGFRAGANDDGDFAKRGATISAGFGDFKSDGYNVLVSADFTQRPATNFRDGSNDIQQDQYYAINRRLNPLASQVSNQAQFTKETTANNFTSAAAANNIFQTGCSPDRLLTATVANGTAALLGVSSTSVLANRTFCNYDAYNDLDIQTKAEDVSLISRATLKVSNNVTAFGEFGYSKSDRTLRTTPVTITGAAPTTNFLVGGIAEPFQAILPVGHPDNPFPGARAAVSYRFENKPRTTDLTNKQLRGLAGIKGSFGDWDWETAVLWNRSERLETRHNYIYLPVLRQLVDGTNRTLASIAADPNIAKDLTTNANAEILQYDAKVATEFGSLPGGPIGFATGVEFRTESLTIVPDAIQARGDILGYATTAIDGERKVKSAFFEFRTPWLKSFEMDFAGRFDSYPGIKTNFVPKVGAKWTVMDNLAVRSAYAEGFRAPAVSQVSPGGAQFFQQGFIDPIRCSDDGATPVPGAVVSDCSKDISGVGGANPNLKPETSKSYSLGIVYSPLSNVDLLVDAFKIEKKGEVALGSSSDVIAHPERFPPGSLLRDPNTALWLHGVNGVPSGNLADPLIPNSGPLLAVSIPWVNQGKTTISGVDFEARVRNSLGEWGKLTTTFKSTYLLSYERVETDGDTPHNVVGTRGGVSDWATSVGDIPRFKFRLASALERGGHQFTGAVNYVSSISFLRRSDGSAAPGIAVYTGTTCHYGGTNNDGLRSADGNTQSVLGAANVTTGGLNNGRQLYITYHPDCTMPAFTTYDVGYFYSGVKDLTVGVQIANLLDTKAPYNPTTSTTINAQDGYNTGLHSNTGRYFTFSANYKFK